ncbi:hypothetical protein IMSAG049_00788 [Clostridiales bacterium]|nr:hypothetical protein IMSAG049_00788 [Clostridiales bacterium]
MSVSDILIIIMVVLVIAIFVLYKLSSRNYRKSIEADEFIKANKQTASIYVIDKKYEKPTEKDLGKQIFEQLNNSAKRHKLCMVKAKVGPQIVTLITDKNLYDVLTPKKTVKVELSGLYIANVVGVNLQDKKKKTWKEKLTLFIKADPKKEAEKIAKK